MQNYSDHNALLAASILLKFPYKVEYLIVELRSIQYTIETLTSLIVSYSSKSSISNFIGISAYTIVSFASL